MVTFNKHQLLFPTAAEKKKRIKKNEKGENATHVAIQTHT